LSGRTEPIREIPEGRKIMIEQYFRAGVRFLWNKPPDGRGATDGALVASAGAATNLTYDGLDGHLAAIDRPLLAAHAQTVLGLAMHANVPYAWLDYAPGRTAHTPIGGNDILTGYMSGCLIVRGTLGAVMSAFHVGTIDNNLIVSRTVKQSFARNLPADATGFSPLGAWTAGEITTLKTNVGGPTVATEKIFGLVTTAGTFHSLLLFNVNQGGQWSNPAGQRYWCVGGIKLVAALNRNSLLTALLS
jgi:hypothetical protein